MEQYFACEFTHGNCTLWPYDLNFESWMMQVIKCIEGIIHIFKAGQGITTS